MMEQEIKTIIEEYQCSGCVCGSDIRCFVKSKGTSIFLECQKHSAGTFITGVGRILLGLPKGFDRLGVCPDMPIHIFADYYSNSWEYDKFNIPVWKYFDKKGNTIVRGLSPRINAPFLHIFKGNQINKINCLELFDEDIRDMD